MDADFFNGWFTLLRTTVAALVDGDAADDHGFGLLATNTRGSSSLFAAGDLRVRSIRLRDGGDCGIFRGSG
jgi:hypothetical protein